MNKWHEAYRTVLFEFDPDQLRIKLTATEEAICDVAASVQSMIDPGGSVHATADYQRHVAGVLTERALQAAHQRARHGH